MSHALFLASLATLAASAGCGAGEAVKAPGAVASPSTATPPDGGAVGSGVGPFIDYDIGPLTTIQSLYPWNGATWLPTKYSTYYSPDVTVTVAYFTNQSLQRDGQTNFKATVSTRGGSDVWIHIGPSSGGGGGLQLPLWMAEFASVHKKLVDSAHLQQALTGIGVCQQTTLPNPTTTKCSDATQYCWKSQCETWNTYDGKYEATDPWALFLPFGLPMINQQTVLFLDYPPDSSFKQVDYLANFTMCRYNRVLEAVTSVPNIYLYDTIVDSRPIGAPGSGMSGFLPNASTYFDTTTPAQGGNYLRPMLELLTNPMQNTKATSTLSVVALGAPAQAAWAKMTGSTVNTLSVGQTPLAGTGAQTSWIGANHPDTTTYSCCPNDPSKSCANTAKYDNQEVCFSEHQDFITDCWEQKMTISGMTYKQALTDCTNQWKLPPAPQYSGSGTQWSADVGCDANWLPANGNDALTFCVQVKLDNNNKAARCDTAAHAALYCGAHSNNPCATFDCAPYPSFPPDPSGATCNQYRPQ